VRGQEQTVYLADIGAIEMERCAEVCGSDHRRRCGAQTFAELKIESRVVRTYFTLSERREARELS